MGVDQISPDHPCGLRGLRGLRGAPIVLEVCEEDLVAKSLSPSLTPPDPIGSCCCR